MNRDAIFNFNVQQLAAERGHRRGDFERKTGSGEVLRHRLPIRHDDLRLSENVVVQPLQHEGLAAAICLKINAIGVVDVPIADRRGSVPVLDLEKLPRDGFKVGLHGSGVFLSGRLPAQH